MFKSLTLLSLIALFLQTSLVNADTEFNKAIDSLCNKQKACIKQSMAAEDMSSLPPEMQQMLEQSINTMCDGFRQRYSDAIADLFPLEKEAIACVNSMVNLSCDQIESGIQTGQCDNFENKLKHYSK